MLLTTKDTKSTKEKMNKVGKGSRFTFTLPIKRLLYGAVRGLHHGEYER